MQSTLPSRFKWKVTSYAIYSNTLRLCIYCFLFFCPTLFAAMCGSSLSFDMNTAHNILSKSSLHTHTAVHIHSIVYIKELMELHKDSGKPTLHLREIEKPLSTQRLFIISCVLFSLSDRKEYFPHKKRLLGQRTHK